MDDLRRQVERWMTKATRDLLTARTMLSIAEPTADISCFHAQQCAEKCLKALLCSLGSDVPRSHDLPRLLECYLALEPRIEALAPSAMELTDYAVDTRYPDNWSEIPLEEAKEAVRKAEAIFKFVNGMFPPAAP